MGIRLKTSVKLKNIKPALFYFARMLIGIIVLNLARWNIWSHLKREMRCVLSFNTASVSPLWARLKAAKTPTSSDYSRCEQWGDITSKSMLFSMQCAIKSARIWLPWPSTINRRWLGSRDAAPSIARSLVCGSKTSFNHCNPSLFDVQPFSLTPKCQFLGVSGGNQSELRCFSF